MSTDAVSEPRAPVKWRVSFEVDLADFIPAEEELKPHDYPLPTWASQTVFDLILNYARVRCSVEKLDVMTANLGETGEVMDCARHRLHKLDGQDEILRQAQETLKVEQVPAETEEEEEQ